MSGLPLNHLLQEKGAKLRGEFSTVKSYRLFDLDGKRPGMIRVQDSEVQQLGHAVKGEVWDIPKENWGAFMSELKEPLTIGWVTLENGVAVLGFLAEQAAATGKIEISNHGGWRAYKAATAAK